MSSSHEAIAARNAEFESAMSAGDAAGLAGVYTDDGQVFATGADEISGAADLEAFWQGVIDSGVKSAKLTTVELDLHDTHAIEHGRFVLADADGNQLDRGKFIVVWANNGGGWRWRIDIFNSSLAA